MSRSPSWGPSRSGSATGGAPLSARVGSLALKPKLPRLQPNVNKKAQEIIAAHLNMGSLAGNSVDTVSTSLSRDSAGPILAQLDSTAPRTARTHDISHICDKGHILIPRPPSSLIEERDHVYEASFLPIGPNSVYSDTDGMWHTKVFPSDTPSSRTDAVLLDNWVTVALARSQEEAARREVKDDLAHSVESLVPILSVALHEVVRQVSHHCIERGSTLEKIWRVYVELFQRVLKQMQQSLAAQKTRTTTIQAELAQAREELRALKAQHPIEMHRVITELEATFTQQQDKFEADLEAADEDNVHLREEIRTLEQELATWYPTFGKYKESYIKQHVPEVAQGDGMQRRRSSLNAVEMSMRARRTSLGSQLGDNQAAEVMPAEIAIAKDFKRLLAVLAPEKRKLIGQELSAVVYPGVRGEKDTRGEKAPAADRGTDAGDAEDAEKIRLLRLEVTGQEERIRALRDEIARLEDEQQANDQAEQQETGKRTFRRLQSQKSFKDGDPGDDAAAKASAGLEKVMAKIAIDGNQVRLKDKVRQAIKSEREADELRHKHREDDVGSSDGAQSSEDD